MKAQHFTDFYRFSRIGHSHLVRQRRDSHQGGSHHTYHSPRCRHRGRIPALYMEQHYCYPYTDTMQVPGSQLQPQETRWCQCQHTSTARHVNNNWRHHQDDTIMRDIEQLCDVCDIVSGDLNETHLHPSTSQDFPNVLQHTQQDLATPSADKLGRS